MRPMGGGYESEGVILVPGGSVVDENFVDTFSALVLRTAAPGPGLRPEVISGHPIPRIREICHDGVLQLRVFFAGVDADGTFVVRFGLDPPPSPFFAMGQDAYALRFAPDETIGVGIGQLWEVTLIFFRCTNLVR